MPTLARKCAKTMLASQTVCPRLLEFGACCSFSTWSNTSTSTCGSRWRSDGSCTSCGRVAMGITKNRRVAPQCPGAHSSGPSRHSSQRGQRLMLPPPGAGVCFRNAGFESDFLALSNPRYSVVLRSFKPHTGEPKQSAGAPLRRQHFLPSALSERCQPFSPAQADEFSLRLHDFAASS